MASKIGIDKLIPWNGSTGTGKDNRSIIDSNFEKIESYVSTTKTPYIGENGNWWVGLVDTGVLAHGKDGKDGKDGDSPHIGANGNWWVGTIDTGVKAGELAQVKETSDGDYIIEDEIGNEWSRLTSKGNFIPASYDRFIGLADYIKDVVKFTDPIAPPLETVIFTVARLSSLIGATVTGIINPTTCIAKNGDILVSSVVSTATERGSVLSISSDKGVTWSEPEIVAWGKNSSWGRNIITMGVDEITGRIYAFFLETTYGVNWDTLSVNGWWQENNDVTYIYSDDHGKTWSSVVSLKTNHPEIYPETNCVYLWPVFENVVTLKNGTLVVPIKKKNATSIIPEGFAAGILYLTPEDRKTQHWRMSSFIDESIDEPNILEYEDNKIMLIGRNTRDANGKKRVYITSDNGATWAKHASDMLIPESSHWRGIMCACKSTFLGNDQYKSRYGLLLKTNGVVDRTNMTLSATKDFLTWFPVYELTAATTTGYCTIAIRGDVMTASVQIDSTTVATYILNDKIDQITKKIWD